MFKKIFLIIVAIVSASCLTKTDKSSPETIAQQTSLGLIPAVAEINYLSGEFVFSKNTKVEIDNAAYVEIFEKTFEKLFLESGNDESNIVKVAQDKELPAEGYSLSIGSSLCEIGYADFSGFYYSLVTLSKLLENNKEGKLQALEILDYPRYGWRGFMLDESRHFFGKEKVKQILDIMAELKLNRFHWHLTDSPGWRIEIPGYPLLTEIGGVGNHSDESAEAKFYTVEDIKEIVAYAEARAIVVVPEIDMPGHARAAVRAYPELSGGGNKEHPDFTFNPGSEKVYDFLEDVLLEITKLFPSEWIHFGGDEVHFANAQWMAIPEVRDLMQRENLKNLKNLKEVEFYFNNRMAKYINSLGKKVLGWDEVLDAKLDNKGTAIVWWRHDRLYVLKNLLKKGYSTILSPRLPCYFDFDQDASHQWGRRWDGFADIESLYNFPDSLKVNIDKTDLIKGMQASMWTERVDTEKRLDYMIYPRIYALAESAWTQTSNKDFTSFSKRLASYLVALDEMGIYYYNLYNPDSTPEPLSPQ